MGNGQSNQQEPDKVETTQLSAKEEDEKETYKDVCEDQAMKCNRDEVDILLRSLLSAIHIDRQSQRIRFVSREAVIEVLHRLDAWLSLLEDIQEDQVDLVFAHLLAMKSMVLACSKHYYDSLSSESEILISLYRTLSIFSQWSFHSINQPLNLMCIFFFPESALLSFCSAIEKYGQFRENGKAIYTAEMHKLNVPRSIVDFRNDLLHGSRVKANETDLVYQAVKAVRWLFTYFWPNLTVKQDEKEQSMSLPMTDW